MDNNQNNFSLTKVFLVIVVCFFSGFIVKTVFVGKEESSAVETVESNEIGEAETLAPAPEFDNENIEPRPINMDEFRQSVGYPEMAKQAEIQGKVTVRVQIDKEGNYVEHTILRSPHPILTHAVESKLPMLKFTPGYQMGVPVKVWVTIPVDFQLTL